MSGPGVGARRQERTSKPSTPSRSPTARATASHMSKNASCKKRCTGTPSRTRSFGANISPAQKHVLGGGPGNVTDKGTTTKRRETHAIVAAASFWYPHGHNPRSASVWPPPRTPRSHAAPLSSSARRSKPTCSSVHAGAPDPPEYRDQTSWCRATKAVRPYWGNNERTSRRYER